MYYDDFFNQIDMSFLVMESSLSLFETELEEQEERMAYANESSYDSYNEDNIFGFNLFEDIADESVSYEPAMEAIGAGIWVAIVAILGAIIGLFVKILSLGSISNSDSSSKSSSIREDRFTLSRKYLSYKSLGIYITHKEADDYFRDNNLSTASDKEKLNHVKNQLNDFLNELDAEYAKICPVLDDALKIVPKTIRTESEILEEAIKRCDKARSYDEDNLHRLLGNKDEATKKQQQLHSITESNNNYMQPLKNTFDTMKGVTAGIYAKYDGVLRFCKYDVSQHYFENAKTNIVDPLEELKKTVESNKTYCEGIQKTAIAVNNTLKNLKKSDSTYRRQVALNEYGKIINSYCKDYFVTAKHISVLYNIAWNVTNACV